MKLKFLCCDGCRENRVIWKNHIDENGVRKRYCRNCWSAHENGKRSKKPTLRKPLRTHSLKRQKQEKEYSSLRKDFLEEHPYCQIAIPGICAHRSTEIHHTNDRNGDKLNDVTYWLAVDRACHNWVHLHPKQARALGYLI